MLELVQAQLAEEYRARGKEALFEQLKAFICEETEMRDYDRVSTQLQMRPNAVAVAVHRLRHRYRELLREEVARTVASPADVEGEMRHFLKPLSASKRESSLAPPPPLPQAPPHFGPDPRPGLGGPRFPRR